jgi:ammonium transporter, Amt family
MEKLMLDIGTTAFMLMSAAFVFIMTPGLAFFYGGFGDRRNVLSIMKQSFVSMGVSTILWYVVGYSLCFSGGKGQLIGNLDKIFLQGITPRDILPSGIPELAFCVYQMMFAILTPALITGAFINRIRFSAYLVILVVWQLLVYYPFAHMIWGDGWLAQAGVLDFAGGIVVHATAGMAALACVAFVGQRRSLEVKPHNVLAIALGTALLWFGWFGFNVGSALAVDGVAVSAFINSQIAAAFAAVTWMILDWVREGKPKFVGFMVGSIAGLATITPAAGFVTVSGAAIIGILAGFVCYQAVILKNKMAWDDALDVWGVHGVGGMLGTIAVGVFATTSINPDGTNGILYGGEMAFFWGQLFAVLGASAYAFLMTYLILLVVNLFSAVRVSSLDKPKGLDFTQHGEMAYDAEDLASTLSSLIQREQKKVQ